MSSDLTIGAYTLAAIVTVSAGISQVPSLTETSTPGSAGSQTQSELAMVDIERAYCVSQLTYVRCGCFANKSGYLRSHIRSTAQGFHHADTRDLARGQAERACRKA